MKWATISKKIDSCIDFVGPDIDYIGMNYIHTRIGFLSVKQKNMIGYLMPLAYKPIISSLRKESTAKMSLKDHVISRLLDCTTLNLDHIASHLKNYDDDAPTTIELTAYKDITKKVTRVYQQSCPVNSLAIVLHGDKGTGKSFFATYIADTLDMTFRRLNVLDKTGHPREQSELNADMYDNFYNVFLIDEIDTIVDVPGVLPLLHNLLDDMRNKSKKIILIMTTNHIDKIKDLPLCRESRVDIIKEIGYLPEEDAALLCKKWDQSWDTIKQSVSYPLTIAKVSQACRDIVMSELKENVDVVRE